jgi:hypothetical protein
MSYEQHAPDPRGEVRVAAALLRGLGWFEERSPGHWLVDGFFAVNKALYFIVAEPDETYALMRLDPNAGKEYPIARVGSADLEELQDIAERLSQMHVGVRRR